MRKVAALHHRPLPVPLVCVSPSPAELPPLASDDPSSVASSTIPATLLALFQQASAASTVACPGHCWPPSPTPSRTSIRPPSLDRREPRVSSSSSRPPSPPTTEPTPAGGAVPPSPFDPTDATYAAARYLCSLGVVADPTLALVAYNCGNPGPACQAASAGYAATGAGHGGQLHGLAPLHSGAVWKRASAGLPTVVQAAAVAYAESQIGTPYVWGGTRPKTGFDCSGLVVWAYGLAGVVVPRVANDQWHDEPHVSLGHLVPGDLVFFGPRKPWTLSPRSRASISPLSRSCSRAA